MDLLFGEMSFGETCYGEILFFETSSVLNILGYNNSREKKVFPSIILGVKQPSGENDDPVLLIFFFIYNQKRLR